MKAVSHQYSAISQPLSCFVVPARAWVLLQNRCAVFLPAFDAASASPFHTGCHLPHVCIIFHGIRQFILETEQAMGTPMACVLKIKEK
jgi:hypothetical protein